MPTPPPDSLTPRESRVLQLLRDGLSNKQIARAIEVSEQTVKYHLKNLYSKLGAVGRAHAVALGSETRGADPRVEAAAPDPRAALELPESPLSLMHRTRRLHAQREAVVDGDRRFTYAQFFERCERWAGALQALGLRHGDRVAVVAPNSHAMLEQFYAVPMIGAVIVPLHRGLTADDLGALIRHCGARVVCASRDYAPLVESQRAECPELVHCVALDAEPLAGWLGYEAQIAAGCRIVPVSIEGEDLLSINYTSGTTHLPLGVALTHRNLWVNTLGTLLHWPVQPDDRYLWLLPMFHANGWGFVWTLSAAGATHVCPGGQRSVELGEVIVRERISVLCAAQSALIGMANVSEKVRSSLPRNLRVLTAGAAPAASTIARIEQRLGWDVTHAYGLTETSPFLAVRELPRHAEHWPVAQRARLKSRQGTELLTTGVLRVVDEEGQDVPQDGSTLGEIVVRGPGVMKGYYRDPQATARAFAGGWFHTGDAAVMHADGSIEIRDRFKDIIISGDELISSVEIEEALMRHPAVREAAVVGVPHARRGESAEAFVVLQHSSRVAGEALRAFVSEHLAAFKVPTRVHLMSALPRTSTGKVRKAALLASQGTGADCPSE